MLDGPKYIAKLVKDMTCTEVRVALVKRIRLYGVTAEPSHKIPMVLGTGHLVKADDSVAALDGDSVSIVQGHLVRRCALTNAASTIPCHVCQIQDHECIAKAAISESSIPFCGTNK